SSGQTAAARKVESVNLKNPETKLTLKIEAQSIGYVNQPVPFYVTASGLDENSQRTVFYEWNFGDSYQDDGKRLSHQYSYPGEYLVTVFARKDKNEQTATHKITILPVNFSLSLNSAGDVQIHNNSAYDVDLSGYSLKGSREVVFPPRSVVLAKATITVAGSRLKTTYQDIVMLYDGNRNVIASTLPKLVVAEPLLGSVVEAKKTTQSFSSPPRAQTTNSTFNTTPSEPEAEAAVILDLPTEEELLADQDFSPTPEPNPDSDSRNVRWPYLALIGLILIAYGAIFFGRKGNSSNQ
ncbi:MAG TPA: PKD domain-containing protein, partial [Candidatus Paceibacterota bacterium]|nr:PKD domain-containing protein [Candidatus Paceibacterota bacterium]